MQKMRPCMSNQGFDPEDPPEEPFIPQVGKEYGTETFLPNGKEVMKKTYPLSNLTLTREDNTYQVDGFNLKTFVGVGDPSYLILDDGTTLTLPEQVDNSYFAVYVKDNLLYLSWNPFVVYVKDGQLVLSGINMVEEESNSSEEPEEPGDNTEEILEEPSGSEEIPEESGDNTEEPSEESTEDNEIMKTSVTITEGFLTVLYTI